MPAIDKNPIQPPDYEKIAADYDARYQDGGADSLSRLIRERMRAVAPGRWLEVGCGTGQWLQRPVVGITPLGLDQSSAMLAKASAKLEEVPLVQGSAVSLPIASGSLAGLAAIHALHHFPDQDKFLRESLRVLEPQGGLLMVGLDAHDPNSEWYVYEYFEGTAERDQARYPDHRLLQKRMGELGFTMVERGLAHKVEEELIGSEVLEQTFLQRRGCSQMALLDDVAYEAGIGRVRQAIDEDPSQVFRASVRLEYLWGVK